MLCITGGNHSGYMRERTGNNENEFRNKACRLLCASEPLTCEHCCEMCAIRKVRRGSINLLASSLKL